MKHFCFLGPIVLFVSSTICFNHGKEKSLWHENEPKQKPSVEEIPLNYRVVPPNLYQFPSPPMGPSSPPPLLPSPLPNSFPPLGPGMPPLDLLGVPSPISSPLGAPGPSPPSPAGIGMPSSFPGFTPRNLYSIPLIAKAALSLAQVLAPSIINGLLYQFQLPSPVGVPNMSPGRGVEPPNSFFPPFPSPLDGLSSNPSFPAGLGMASSLPGYTPPFMSQNLYQFPLVPAIVKKLIPLITKGSLYQFQPPSPAGVPNMSPSMGMPSPPMSPSFPPSPSPLSGLSPSPPYPTGQGMPSSFPGLTPPFRSPNLYNIPFAALLAIQQILPLILRGSTYQFQPPSPTGVPNMSPSIGMAPSSMGPSFPSPPVGALGPSPPLPTGHGMLPPGPSPSIAPSPMVSPNFLG